MQWKSAVNPEPNFVPLEFPGSAQAISAFGPIDSDQDGGSEPIDGSSKPFRLVTLGCKVNQYESQYVRESLLANGFREAGKGEPAELAVVNTCTVTAESDSKSRQMIRQLAKHNPGIKIVVMGCYATRDSDAVKRLPGVAAVVTEKAKIDSALESFGVKKKIRGIRSFEGRQRAFVKVQDGCVLQCTFCIIPKVRPGIISRPIDEIVEEVHVLVDSGYREIILTGIHLGHYGVDLSLGRPKVEWQRLWHLLDRLANLPGEFRIRLSSLEATEVTDEFLSILSNYQERICPHLHLSLQSGSDAVLARMNRRYRMATYLSKCDQVRQRLDQPAFTTDIIVGFPGETDAEFEETLQTVGEVGFSKIHIFPFSAREGTPAATRTDKIDPIKIAERREALSEVANLAARSYHRQLIGRKLEMLVESPDPECPDLMRGTACRYAPLRLRTLPSLARQLVPVTAVGFLGESLQVEPYVEV